jgi:hypothetical protein
MMPFILPDKKRHNNTVLEDAVPDFPVVFGPAFLQAALECLKVFEGEAAFDLTFYPYLCLRWLYRAVPPLITYRSAR